MIACEMSHWRLVPLEVIPLEVIPLDGVQVKK